MKLLSNLNSNGGGIDGFVTDPNKPNSATEVQYVQSLIPIVGAVDLVANFPPAADNNGKVVLLKVVDGVNAAGFYESDGTTWSYFGGLIGGAIDPVEEAEFKARIVTTFAYSETFGDGSAKVFNINHNLGEQYVREVIFETANNDKVLADVNFTDANNLTITVQGQAPAVDEYTIICRL